MHVDVFETFIVSVFVAILGITGAKLLIGVRRAAHPSRSYWPTCLASLMVVTGLPLIVLAVSIALLSLLATLNVNTGRIGVMAAVGAFAGALFGSWEMCMRWMAKPRRTTLTLKSVQGLYPGMPSTSRTRSQSEIAAPLYPHLRWSRGMFRAWTAASVLWIGAIVWIGYGTLTAPLPAAPQTTQGSAGGRVIDFSDLIPPQTPPLMPGLERFAIIAFAPVLGALALYFVVLWIGCGFRGQRRGAS